jgi:hypothetical protein
VWNQHDSDTDSDFSETGDAAITAEALAAARVAMGQPTKRSGDGISRVLWRMQFIIIVLVMLSVGSGGICSKRP